MGGLLYSKNAIHIYDGVRVWEGLALRLALSQRFVLHFVVLDGAACNDHFPKYMAHLLPAGLVAEEVLLCTRLVEYIRGGSHGGEQDRKSVV